MKGKMPSDPPKIAQDGPDQGTDPRVSLNTGKGLATILGGGSRLLRWVTFRWRKASVIARPLDPTTRLDSWLAVSPVHARPRGVEAAPTGPGAQLFHRFGRRDGHRHDMLGRLGERDVE